jgi:hypothetical protein
MTISAWLTGPLRTLYTYAWEAVYFEHMNFDYISV